MTEASETKVAVVGLGYMGEALAVSLLNRGFPVTVWNRTPGKAAAVRAAGATWAPTVTAAATGADLLVVCLLDHSATRAAVMTDDTGTVLRDKTVVQLSTTTADEVEDLAGWSTAKGAALLKGAILVYPDRIKAGKGPVIYGGPRALFERWRTPLQAMGGQPCWVCEDPAGLTAATSASYSFIYASVLSFLYGAAICNRADIPVETFARQIIEPFVSGGTLMSIIEHTAERAGKRHYEGDLQATLHVWNEALGHTLTSIEASGMDSALLQPLKALLDRSEANGQGQKDIAAAFETLIAGATQR